MKRTKRTFTAIFAAFILFSAIPNIMSNEAPVELMNKMLGYPATSIITNLAIKMKWPDSD